MSFSNVKTFPEKTVPTASAEAISSTALTKKVRGGVLVQALDTNTVNVYVGDSSVTTSTGLVLAPGKGVFIECDDPADLYCISGAAGQKVRVLGVGG